MSMIHELPGLIGYYDLEASIATHCPARGPGRVPRSGRARPLHGADGLDPDKAARAAAGPACAQPLSRVAATRRAGRSGRGWDLAEDARIVLAVGFADHRKGIDLFVDVGLAS